MPSTSCSVVSSFDRSESLISAVLYPLSKETEVNFNDLMLLFIQEAIQCVKDFKAPDLHDVFISETINFIAEAKSSENRRKIGQFIRELIVSEVVSVSSVLKG